MSILILSLTHTLCEQYLTLLLFRSPFRRQGLPDLWSELLNQTAVPTSNYRDMPLDIPNGNLAISPSQQPERTVEASLSAKTDVQQAHKSILHLVIPM